jgi:hypothetical protein
MSILGSIRWLAITLLAGLPWAASAQIGSAGNTLLIPVVAATASFQSDIYVRNLADTQQTVDITFYEAETSTSPGTKVCTQLVIAPYLLTRFNLATQCTLDASNHHGFMILTDSGALKDKLLQAYVRTANPQGIGFSVEAFPIGHIGGATNYAEVLGLTRKAATANSPAYQSNCFVATLDDPVDYEIQIYNNSGPGSGTITGSLQPFQMRRYLEVFSLAGFPAGDVNYAVAFFRKTNAAQSANTLISFCTVQDNTSFGADFRIAKGWDGADPSRSRAICFATNPNVGSQGCTNTLVASPPSVGNVLNKERYLTMLYAPDTVHCALTGPRIADLELQLVKTFPVTVLAGGNNQSSFTYATGPRSAINNGFHQIYWIEVGFREGGNATTPIPFGFSCTAGNGMAFPYYNGSVPDSF